MSTERNRQIWTRLKHDYGMAIVLLLLVVILSLLTVKQHNPVGSEAGQQVASAVLHDFGPDSRILIVAGQTAVDESFVTTVEQQLTAAGRKVSGTVTGGPADARRVIETFVADGEVPDAIAATSVAASWNIYDRFEQIGSEKCVSPVSYTWPTFLKLDNLLNIANQTAIYAIIAIGMTLVIVTAGIDLSVGSLIALASVVSALFITTDFAGGQHASVLMMTVGCLLAVAACGLCGFFNGIMITRFSIPPFIATLAMMMMAKGLAMQAADGESISTSSSPGLPDSFTWIGGGTTLGCPNPVILMIALYAVAHVLMSKTVFGRYVYAVGGNAEAARLSGVAVKRVVLVVYTLCGALAGLGGIVQSSKLGTGDPKLGLMFELDVIAAVVVGGTSIMGGEGRIYSTLIGALIIAVIKNGMNLMDLKAHPQLIVLGAVILLSVLFDTVRRRSST